MGDTDRALSDPTFAPLHTDAPASQGKDVATRAADLADDLYARAEQQRRKESLEHLLARGQKA